MPVVSKADAPVFDTGHAVITGLAAPSRGSREISAWRVRLAADQSSPAHALEHEEVFVVLEGRIVASFDDREEAAEAGGALIVPAEERFSLSAPGAPAEAVCILPAGAKAKIDGKSFVPPWAE